MRKTRSKGRRYRRTRRTRQHGGAGEAVAEWRRNAEALKAELDASLDGVLIGSLKKPNLSLPEDGADYAVEYNGLSTTLQEIGIGIAEKVMQVGLSKPLDELTFGELSTFLSTESEDDFFSLLPTLMTMESAIVGVSISADTIKSVGGPFYSMVLYANRNYAEGTRSANTTSVFT